MAILEKAITDDGSVAEQFRSYSPHRLVTKIGSLDRVRVRHSSWVLPGGHDEMVLERVLNRALDDRHQFSTERPALLALMLSRDPDAAPLWRGDPSLVDRYFEKYPHLSAVIGIPCPSINGAPTVIRPEPDATPARSFPISEEEARVLAESFVVRLQLSDFWEQVEKELATRPLRAEEREGE